MEARYYDQETAQIRLWPPTLLAAFLRLKLSEWFSKGTMAKDIAAIHKRYEDAGYPNAGIRTRDVFRPAQSNRPRFGVTA